MLFASYHPETSSSQNPGKSNIWRLILNFTDFLIYTESTHTHTHTHTHTVIYVLTKRSKTMTMKKEKFCHMLVCPNFQPGKI